MGTLRIKNPRASHLEGSVSRPVLTTLLIVAAASIVASCASAPPPKAKKRSSEYFPESKYGVKASPRVVEYGQPVPQGGGRYMVGKPYKVKGKTYRPFEKKKGYTAVGYASWYGSAFHGRYTANGEVYDMDTLSAAHPTMPLPSYARVTNLKNGASVVVRVNDRGPYERDRLIDLSSKTAELLQVKRHGAAKVKVEYIGPARMEGHDKQMLMATYVAPDNTEIGNPNVMVAMARVKKESAVAVAMRSQPATRSAPAPTIAVAARQPAPVPTVAVAMRAPASSPQIVLAMAPVPRARPTSIVAGGTAIDPYNYEILAAQNAPVAAPVAEPVQAMAIAEPEIVAQPDVVQASTVGGTTYGERSLGSFTVENPAAFEAEYQQPVYRSARSSYASDPDFTDAQRAIDRMAKNSRNAGLEEALQLAVARAAAERSADATEIAVGVFADAGNAKAMAAKLAWLGRPAMSDVAVGGRTLHQLRILVADSSVSEKDALAAVAAAGARDAFIVTR
jgi:rare lipoprotein A